MIRKTIQKTFILSSGFLLGASSLMAQDAYSVQELSNRTQNGNLVQFYGPKGTGGAHKTPLLRLGAGMKANRDNLGAYVEGGFATGRDHLVKDYADQGRQIEFVGQIPALDFVAATFFKRGEDHGRRLKKSDREIKYSIHRSPEEDQAMKNSIGAKAFQSLYGKALDPANQNPKLPSDFETAKAELEKLGIGASVAETGEILITLSDETSLNVEPIARIENGRMETGFIAKDADGKAVFQFSQFQSDAGTSYMVFDATKPIQLAHKDQVFISSQDQLRLYDSLEEIPAEVLSTANGAHVSLSNFHKLDSMLTGQEYMHQDDSWKEKLESIYKSSKDGKVAIGEDAFQDILELLDPKNCPVAA